MSAMFEACRGFIQLLKYNGELLPFLKPRFPSSKSLLIVFPLLCSLQLAISFVVCTNQITVYAKTFIQMLYASNDLSTVLMNDIKLTSDSYCSSDDLQF
jgi:hypothetical protein